MISRHPTIEHMDVKAAQLFKQAVSDIRDEKQHIIVAMPGGRSIIGMLKILARDTTMRWEGVHFYMVDERLVPIQDEQSNYRQLHELLLGPCKISGVPFVYKDTQPDYGKSDYEHELKKVGGAFDIVLLGAGEDGHVAGLYPSHHSITNQETGYLLMDDSPKPPPKRITATRKLIEQSTIGILLFSGQQKKQAFEHFMDPTIPIERCPAKIIERIPTQYIVTGGI